MREGRGGEGGRREGLGVQQTRTLAMEKRWTVAAAPSLFASAVGTAMHKTTSSTGGSAPGLIYSALGLFLTGVRRAPAHKGQFL